MFVDFFFFFSLLLPVCDFLPGFAFGVSRDTVRFGDGFSLICFLFHFAFFTIMFFFLTPSLILLVLSGLV